MQAGALAGRRARRHAGPWFDGGVEAVIVAGGLGSRMLPLTAHRPKHLLPVAGEPFVVHQIAKLAASGLSRVVLATSYHAELFEPVLGDGRAWGIELIYAREVEPLGTAGAIRHVAPHLRSGPDEPVVILNGDILSGHDLSRQLSWHQGQAADITLHLVEVTDARAYGCVPTDRAGNVTAFLEKSPDPISHQINAGCYVFARRVIDSIPVGRMVSVERETFPHLLTEGLRVQGWVDPSYWLDVGTPSALCQASSDLVRGIATSPAHSAPPAESWLSASAFIAPGASVRGGTAVGPGAKVESGVRIEGGLIYDGATVGSRSRIVDSVVGPGAVVGPDVVLQDAVVGDNATVGAGCELVRGARVGSDVVLPDRAIRFS